MDITQITIRQEEPADQQAIRQIIVAAFTEEFGSAEGEVKLVDQLPQSKDAQPIISLVASDNNKILGQVLFSRVRIIEFPDIPVCVIGPVAVDPPHQRKGIGSKLIQRGLARCEELGYKALFATGSLKYYSHFGFAPIKTTKLHTIFNTEHDMVLELQPGILKNTQGLVDYPDPWHAFL